MARYRLKEMVMLVIAATTLGGCASNTSNDKPGWAGCRAGTVLLCKGEECRCTDKHTVQDLLFIK